LRAPDDADGGDIDQMLAAICCPVMLAYGTDSWVTMPPPERMARIRRLSLITFPNASHWLHHTSRDAYIIALSDFLSTTVER
jgi:pimeloyl-ACP methyl ester carboxylesterase